LFFLLDANRVEAILAAACVSTVLLIFDFRRRIDVRNGGGLDLDLMIKAHIGTVALLIMGLVCFLNVNKENQAEKQPQWLLCTMFCCLVSTLFQRRLELAQSLQRRPQQIEQKDE